MQTAKWHARDDFMAITFHVIAGAWPSELDDFLSPGGLNGTGEKYPSPRKCGNHPSMCAPKALDLGVVSNWRQLQAEIFNNECGTQRQVNGEESNADPVSDAREGLHRIMCLLLHVLLPLRHAHLLLLLLLHWVHLHRRRPPIRSVPPPLHWLHRCPWHVTPAGSRAPIGGVSATVCAPLSCAAMGGAGIPSTPPRSPSIPPRSRVLPWCPTRLPHPPCMGGCDALPLGGAGCPTPPK